ncbi:hypothetical protein [Liquorilactobacillus mali]|uniref:Uncharacterized protein n=1 Tax=Liquorilactobacillus mali KCTC 3596 = DSM 20444 TaxID=1046596 RepID=J1F5Q1_9LACO|nr:hypothetical protein [Liquorilactobacillus mali]EJF01960.1 hypothetical protein LMA_00519 [Liquorilactobacillus mali KCTC 3596 = DSM 20444]KRN09961.1 hypothetical protein FD00_GL000588 [Liquorilactobacillus mali KCTC 3596 = DSM 20444]MDC7953701.1 hypothetical protein [Liquorilactobacillus mali]MDV7758116.1 hypothetical protein [Liquorilactobacillus mali]QFQ74093.1 hypothetical protein LM596_02615 [Liquorilactobacillus mali]
MSDIRSDEQVFERYYGNYTIKLWHYPEFFSLLENCQDSGNLKTISSTLNIKFALVRYRKILSDVSCLKSISSEVSRWEKKQKMEEHIFNLEKMIAVLKIFEKKIDENPNLCKQTRLKRANILNIDKCCLFKV